MSTSTPESDSPNQIKAGKIFRNFSFLTMGKILGDGFTFLLFIILSRDFGQEGIGEYSLAMAITGFFAAISEFGLYHYSIKEMSRCQGALGDYYGKILSVRIILSVGVFLLLLAFLPFCPFSTETKIIIGLIGAYQIIYMIMDGYCALFVASEEMRVAGMLEFSLRMIIALSGIGICLLGGNLLQVTIAFPAVTLLLTIATHKLASREHGKPCLAISRESFIHIIRSSATYATANILFILSARIDVILLGFYLGAAAAGIYNVAYRLIFIFMVITHFASVSIFPLASRLFIESRDNFFAFYQNTLNLLILICIPASLILWLAAPDIITIFFGAEFKQSIIILRILAPLFFLTMMENILATFLMSCEKEKERTTGYWLTAWTNIIGNLILIPLYGCAGAAIATLISKVLQTGYYFYKLTSLFGLPRIGPRTFISLAACLSMVLPPLLLPSIPTVITLPISLILGCATLLLIKDIRNHELQFLLNILKKKQ